MSEREPTAPAGALEYALVRTLAEADSAETAVSRMLEVLGTSFGWAVGEAWLVERRERVLRHAGDWSQDVPELVAFRVLGPRLSFVPGVGLPGRVWASGEPIWIPDIAGDPNFARTHAAARAGLHAAVALPVGHAAGPLGVVAFFATEVREPDPAQLRVMATAVHQVGIYLARVQAEKRLAAFEESSGSIFEAALDCIVTMDADGAVVDLNPAAEATFGLARDEARGRRLAELIIPEDYRDAHERALGRYLETGTPSILNQRLELEAVRADGDRFPVELTVTRLGSDEPPMFAGFVRDITARRRSDEHVTELLARERQARHEAEQVSEALQRSLLPPHLPAIPGLELGAAYEAAAPGSVVGGDFYDVFPVGPDRWGVVVGDVSGKGADAASLTALVRYTLRTAAVRERNPRAVLCVVNDALLRETRPNAYCTIVYAELLVHPEPRLRFAVAGHPPPLVVGPEGASRTVGRPGTLLGAVEDPPFDDDEVVLAGGETLLLYTDGVTEARTPGGLLGMDGLRALVRECPDLRPEALVTCIVSGVHGGAGHRVTDDIALLAVRRAQHGTSQEPATG